MRTFKFNQEQLIKKPIEEVFEFFSDARNLQAITPPWLSFDVLSPQPIELQAGTLIDYKLKVRGIPFRWQTEITEWEPPIRFVDIQKRGPYNKWHHTHVFKAEKGGTRIFDDIEYAVPGGSLVHKLFVRRDVTKIFEYRKAKLDELFG